MRILVLVEGTLGHDMAGPSIRASGLARALASRHEVTLAARGDTPGAHHGIPVIPYTRQMVLRAARAHDAVLAPWIPPYVHASRRPGTRLIADLYDPLELELRAAGADPHERSMLERLERLQAEHADVLLCATEAQARRLRARYPRAARKLLVV
ncbi:MAG TPA: glycosyltransferase, partial [Solirubrobacteraceae bacterium]|nr:glycosyltransferase [Solirubrobacteraceae bacterium]